jgi:hypothetical protein
LEDGGASIIAVHKLSTCYSKTPLMAILPGK